MNIKQKILDAVLFVVVIVWCLVSMYESYVNPIDPYNFTVEEQIKYERMIF